MPFPFKLRGSKYLMTHEGVLVDDAELVLSKSIGARVLGASSTGELMGGKRKPSDSRTLEDVLREFRFEASCIYDDPNIGGEDRADALYALDAEYAEEIRKLTEVDE